MANVSQLQPSLVPQVQTNSSEAPEKDADFLALRLLNKRARLRLSAVPFDLASFPTKSSLLAIANSKGWFSAITRDATGASAFILSPLADLRSALATASAEDEQPFRPQRRVPTTGVFPHMIMFACNDTRLLLGLVDGFIHVYATDPLLSGGEGPVQPIHVFTTSSSASLLSIKPNPEDIPELVAVLRDCSNSPGSLAVELLDVQKLISSGGWMAGKSPSTTPTSVSWSPKGKQLALGLQSGDIVTFSPTATATPKSCIPHPPSANTLSVISIHWLSTSSFHTIYAPPGPLTPEIDQTHIYVSLDAKNNSAQNIKFNNPYLPFPGLRPPGEFMLCLRGWSPSKVLLFIGDSTSSDIGLIGSVTNDSGESWHNLSLEETSTPSLPLDKDQNDTVLLGMDVDLTSSGSYRHSTASGEALELPAHPIMYVYASDGTILGWRVLNTTGASYPGMITASNASAPSMEVPSAPSSMVRELSSDMQMTPTISPATDAPTDASSITPAPSVFSQSFTPAIQTSAFGTSGPMFGQPAFGQSGFGQQPPSGFNQGPFFSQPTTSGFGSTPTTSPFGQFSTPTFATTGSGGFGAFSSAGPAKFGQPTFGFGGFSQTPAASAATAVPEESMAADDAPTFGGLGLGTASSQDTDSKPSIFGKPSVPTPSTQQESDTNLLKPGTGFGAFGGGFDQKSPFARPSAFSTAQQPATTFASAFQPKAESAPSTSFSASPSLGTTQPAFGQSSFGQFQSATSGFGKPSFGATATATTPVVVPTTNTSTSGGFSAFASGTQSAFSAAASKNVSTKPVWATSDSSKPPEPATGFGKPVESTESKTPSTVPPKTMNAPSTPSPFGATSAFSMASRFVARDSTTKDEDESRPSSPAPVEKKEATAFASSAPGPSTGAFSNLQTTPSVFVKPASGSFGELPKDSPFFGSKPSESAFSLTPMSSTPSSTLPKPGSTQPLFGAPSMPGGGLKSAFAPATTTPAQPPPVPSGGAFSAFSGGSGTGFSAFSSGKGKSFSDLLRSDGEKPSEAKPSTPDVTPKKPVQAAVQPSVSTTPSFAPTQEPPKAPPTPPIVPKVEEEETRIVEVKPPEVPVETEVKSKPAEPVPAQEPSLESISSSTSSSFVKVEQEEGEVVEEEAQGRAEPQDESFLSDVPSESDVSDESEDGSEELSDEPADEPSEEPSEASEEEATEEPVQAEAEPTEGLLPIPPAPVRSPSTTPKAEHPKVSLSPPPQTPSPTSVPRVSPVRDQSATPPESLDKATSTVPAQASIPAPKTSLPPTSPFNLVPRLNANNRPIRSSPLASTPLVLEGETDKSPPTSKSAPAIMTPGPATPKEPLAPTLSLPTKFAVDEPARPATPPLSPMFSAGKPAPSVFTPATTAAPPSLFAPSEKGPTPSMPPPTTPGPAAPVFSLPSSFPASTPSTVTPSGWGTPPKPAEVTSTAPKAPSMLFGGGQPGLFGAKGVPSPPFSSPSFTSPVPSMVPSPTPPPSLPKTPTPEQGMQAECTLLLDTFNKELDHLKAIAKAASVNLEGLKKMSGIIHQKADLADPRKWLFNDMEEYGKVLVNVQEDVKALKLQRVSMRKMLKELESNVLKVTTRREEIARFSKARTDAEFTKMLKIRTLAPEYSETQSQLRKKVRAIKDRIQKLEDHLQDSKKRTNELRTGRPSIRPPSLDTVNRTLRNIGVAIDRQKQEISQLRDRMGQLDLSTGVGAREPLTISSMKRPINVIPSIAVTTAATLNAERSAQRLKKALLASRTEPLLNTTVTTSHLPAAFQTPQKTTGSRLEAKTSDRGSFSSPTTPMMSFPSSMPGWTPPTPTEFASPVSYDVTPSRSRGGTKHHQKPIMLKKNASPTATLAATPSVLGSSAFFEWKPVEPIKPASSLPFALRPTASS